MKLVEPVLFVCGDDEYSTLNEIKKSFKRDVDIVVPYEYQRKHFNLIFGYVAAEYLNHFPAKLLLEDTLAAIKKNAYSDYLMFYLIRFLRIHKEWNMGLWELWKRSPQPVYIKDKKIGVLRYYELKKFYHTVVIDLDLSNGNKWNRMWRLVPNYFNDSSINMILENLTNDGYLVFNNHNKENGGKIFDYTRYGFNRIEEDLYQKIPLPKIPFKVPRNWL